MTPADKRKWFAFVASQPCAACGRAEVQVCHTTGMDAHRLGRGERKKSHDLMVFPGCATCHAMIDSYQYYEHLDPFVRKLMHSSGVQTFISMTIIAGYEAGVLGVRK